jgi:hypothetical protein
VSKPATLLGVIIIVNACLWGFTIIMVSRTLSGTGAYQEIQHILGGAAGTSTVIVGGGMAGLMSLMRTKEREAEQK